MVGLSYIDSMSCPKLFSYKERRDDTIREMREEKLTFIYLLSWSCLIKINVHVTEKCKLEPKTVLCLS